MNLSQGAELNPAESGTVDLSIQKEPRDGCGQLCRFYSGSGRLMFYPRMFPFWRIILVAVRRIGQDAIDRPLGEKASILQNLQCVAMDQAVAYGLDGGLVGLGIDRFN